MFFPGYLEALQSGRIEAFVEGLDAAGKRLDPATRQATLSWNPSPSA